MIRGIIPIVAVLLLAGLGHGATIFVPDSYSTIQSAIDASSGGDTIVVRPGTYTENIDFSGKAIVVKSELGPDVTIIDGSSPANPDRASVVTFAGGEGPGSVIEGFTLTGGKGTLDLNSKMSGGGIFCGPAASPVVRGNIICDNSCWNGGGIHCFGSSAPLITGNEITRNTCKNGGGVDCDDHSTPVISHNVITFNRAPVYGGGIRCFTGCDATVEFNVITDNDATSTTATSGRGGGVYCYMADPVIRHNEILRNTSSKCGGGVYSKTCSPTIEFNMIGNNESTHEYGGGIQCSTYANTVITSNVIVKNKALLGGGVNSYKGSRPTLTSNLIAWNDATEAGGGINCLDESITLIVNCTLYGNHADNGGGGMSLFVRADASVFNSIFWANTSPVGPTAVIGEPNVPASLAIDYSDVEGGKASIRVNAGSTLIWGPNMIVADPLFVDEADRDLHLMVTSPCFGSGDSSLHGTSGNDFEGDPRIAGQDVDMGADEFHAHLYVTGSALPGSPVKVRVIGRPGKGVLLALGIGVLNTPVQTPHGYHLLYLKTPPLKSWSLGSVPPEGVVKFSPKVPSGWSPGSTHPFQALVGPWTGTETKLTNLLLLEVE